MLEEKIRYDTLPIEVRFLEVVDYPLHFHQGMEIVYVLQGSITLQCGSSKYNLSEDHIFVINKGEVHGFYHASPDCIIAFMHIKTLAFLDCFPNILTSCIRTNSYTEKDDKYTELLSKILSILNIYISRDLGYEEHLIQATSELLVYLDENYNHFIFDRKTVIFRSKENKIQNDRMRNIIRYCYQHHNEKVTLETLSKEENLSVYYLSHLIRDTLGISFRELLAFARIEISERILLGTDKSIDKIAMEIGFSSARYYIAHFKYWYGVTPQEYRDLYIRYTKHNVGVKTQRANAVLLLERIKKKQNELTGFSGEQVCMRSGTVHVVGKRDDLLCGEKVDCADRLFIFDGVNWKPFKMLVDRTVEQEENCFCEAMPEQNGYGYYAWDTVIAVPYIIKKAVNCRENILINCMNDKKNEEGLISGQRGIYTYNGIPKPAFFAYQCLYLLEGEILQAENSYIVIKKRVELGADQYIILVWNVDKDLEDLLFEKMLLDDFRKTINSFGNYGEVTVELRGLSGMYEITQYTLNNCTSLFNFMIENGDCKEFEKYQVQEAAKLFANPGVSRRYESFNGSFFHKVSGTDLSIQCIVLKKQPN